MVGFGPNASNKYVTTYFRHEFQVEDASRVLNLAMGLVRDDGAAVYLNDVEVARDRLSPGATFSELAIGGPIGGADESTFFPFTVDPALLADGRNVLEVEIHQANGTSSDISFDLDLTATIEPEPEIPGVLVNDFDADGDTLTGSLITGPANGSLTFNPDGTFEYTHNPGFVGVDTFTYRASDGTLNSNVATVSISVVPGANTPPDVADDTYSVDEDGELTVDAAAGLLANDTDGQGDPLTATLLAGPTGGSVTLNADGSFTYTPAADFFGSDTFTYTANDGFEDSQPAVVTITVNGTPDAPLAVLAMCLIRASSAATRSPTAPATVCWSRIWLRSRSK